MLGSALFTQYRSTRGSQGSSDPGLAVGQVAQTQDVTAAHAVSSSFVLLLPWFREGGPGTIPC